MKKFQPCFMPLPLNYLVSRNSKKKKKNVQNALRVLEWKKAILEEIRALEKK